MHTAHSDLPHLLRKLDAAIRDDDGPAFTFFLEAVKTATRYLPIEWPFYIAAAHQWLATPTCLMCKTRYTPRKHIVDLVCSYCSIKLNRKRRGITHRTTPAICSVRDCAEKVDVKGFVRCLGHRTDPATLLHTPPKAEDFMERRGEPLPAMVYFEDPTYRRPRPTPSPPVDPRRRVHRKKAARTE